MSEADYQSKTRSWRATVKPIVKRATLIAVLIGLTIGAGAVFCTLEKNNVAVHVARRDERSQKFAIDVCERISPKTPTCQSDVISVMQDQDGSNMFGDNLSQGLHGNKSHWSLWEYSFFAVTVYTTIGYGIFAPTTKWGQLAVMIYATFTIPLFLYVIADIGDLLNMAMLYVWGKVHGVFSFLPPCRSFSHKSVPLLALLVAAYVYMATGAALLCWAEGWSYFTAFYYCFQTLFTIGFGDVYPAKGDGLSAAITAVYVVVGLAFVSMSFNAISDSMRKIHVKLILKETDPPNRPYGSLENQNGEM